MRTASTVSRTLEVHRLGVKMQLSERRISQRGELNGKSGKRLDDGEKRCQTHLGKISLIPREGRQVLVVPSESVVQASVSFCRTTCVPVGLRSSRLLSGVQFRY